MKRIYEGIRKFWGESFLMGVGGPRSLHKPITLDAPMRTLLSQNSLAVVEPFVMCYHGGEGQEKRNETVEMPLGTLDTANRYGLVSPFLISYYGNSGANDIDTPLPAVTANDHFGLVEGETVKSDLDGLAIDIRLRMLSPSELAAAHSFPPDYQFAGNRGDIVRQVGNSWPVEMGTALLKAILKTTLKEKL